MNTALLLIWIFVFLVMGALVIGLLRNIHVTENEKQIYNVNFNQNNCYKNNDVNSFPKVPGQCCVVDNVTYGNQPYTDPTTGLQYLINTQPYNYETVCYDFCQKINVQTGVCQDTSGDYIKCLNSLKPPTGCISYENILAQKNGIPYYAYQVYVPGESGNCPTTVEC